MRVFYGEKCPKGLEKKEKKSQTPESGGFHVELSCPVSGMKPNFPGQTGGKRHFKKDGTIFGSPLALRGGKKRFSRRRGIEPRFSA